MSVKQLECQIWALSLEERRQLVVQLKEI